MPKNNQPLISSESDKDNFFEKGAELGLNQEALNLIWEMKQQGFSKKDLITQVTDCILSKEKLTSKQKLSLISLNKNNKLSILKRVHAHTLANLFLNPKLDFHTKNYHYDWWMFPMYIPPEWRWQQRNYDCSCNKEDVAILMADEEFFQNYIKGIHLYIRALEQKGWNDYPVRLARLLQSLSLFCQVGLESFDKFENEIMALEKAAKRVIGYIETPKLALYKEYQSYSLFYNGYINLKTFVLDQSCSGDIVNDDDIKLFTI